MDPAEAKKQIDKATRALFADYQRQGGHLEIDDVNRVLQRRGLTGGHTAEVLESLAAAGVEIDGVSADDMGYETRRTKTAASAVGSEDPSDGFGLFLTRAASHKLLSGADEKRLGRRVAAGTIALDELGRRWGVEFKHDDQRWDWLGARFVLFSHYMSDEWEQKALSSTDRLLVERVRTGHAAFLQMVQANIRLVVNIAKPYARTSSLDISDLTQDGIIGLMRAVEKFDASRGYRFSTYATWWIRQAITRSIADKGSTVRLPAHMYEKQKSLRSVERSLILELGREPSSEELAAHLAWEIADVEAVKDLQKFEMLSLDAPVGNDDGSAELVDLAVVQYEDPADIVMELATAGDIVEMLSHLPDRSNQILRRRFGIGGYAVETLATVGAVFGVTRERIRQLEMKALNQLVGVAMDYGYEPALKPIPAPEAASEAGGSDTEGDDCPARSGIEGVSVRIIEDEESS